MPEFQAAQMLVVFLGASEFPNASQQFAANPAFNNSAADLRDYFKDRAGLSVPERNIEWLFDDSRSPADQLAHIAQFLQARGQELESNGGQVSDLMIYYVGHGLFTRNDQTYCLAIRSTNTGIEGASSIRVADLAALIKDRATFLRRFLIFDCCFSAATLAEFQSSQAAAVNLKRELPSRGTALFCSSSAHKASLSPQGLPRTMFSDALITVLREGNKNFGPRLSLSDLGDAVRQYLRNKYPHDWVRPEVLSPDQPEEDIACFVPLFPNRAYQPEQQRMEQSQAEVGLKKPTAVKKEAMLKWGTVITIFYVLIVLGLFGVPLSALATGEGKLNPYKEWGAWIPIGIFLASQALLLFLSVDTSWRRLKPRAHILVSCLVTGMSLALLTSAAVLSIVAGASGDHLDKTLDSIGGGGILGCWATIWVAWTIVFYLYTRNSSTLITRATSWLLKGSILELLVAVPTHIIVRRRQDCSAPVVTSFGIATGIAIMLLSFGPSVLLLYKKRMDEYASRGSAAKGLP